MVSPAQHGLQWHHKYADKRSAINLYSLIPSHVPYLSTSLIVAFPLTCSRFRLLQLLWWLIHWTRKDTMHMQYLFHQLMTSWLYLGLLLQRLLWWFQRFMMCLLDSIALAVCLWLLLCIWLFYFLGGFLFPHRIFCYIHGYPHLGRSSGSYANSHIFLELTVSILKIDVLDFL